jgi:hypothetical protein
MPLVFDGDSENNVPAILKDWTIHRWPSGQERLIQHLKKTADAVPVPLDPTALREATRGQLEFPRERSISSCETINLSSVRSVFMPLHDG